MKDSRVKSSAPNDCESMTASVVQIASTNAPCRLVTVALAGQSATAMSFATDEIILTAALTMRAFAKDDPLLKPAKSMEKAFKLSKRLKSTAIYGEQIES